MASPPPPYSFPLPSLSRQKMNAAFNARRRKKEEEKQEMEGEKKKEKRRSFRGIQIATSSLMNGGKLKEFF